MSEFLYFRQYQHIAN